MRIPASRARPLAVIEDNAADFETISLLLQEAGFASPILHFQTGEEALAYMGTEARKHKAERTIPGHILLDLNLPGLSGLDVLRELRGDTIFRPVPVTVLTTSSHPRDIEGCYRAGANSYLIKPVNFERFEAMLREFAIYWFEIATVPLPGEIYA